MTFKPGERAVWLKTDDYELELEQKDDGKLFVHLSALKKWTKHLYYELLNEFLNIKEFAKKDGHKQIYTIVPEENKMVKFPLAFGFHADLRLQDYYGNNFILMSQEI